MRAKVATGRRPPALRRHAQPARTVELLAIIAVMFVAFGLSFLLINIRQVVKGEEFRGTCATNNPMVKNRFGECRTCGAKVGDDCALPAEAGAAK